MNRLARCMMVVAAVALLLALLGEGSPRVQINAFLKVCKKYDMQ